MARAAGAINRARTTLEVALGPGALSGGLDDGGETLGAGEQPGQHGHVRLPDDWQGDIEFKGVRFSHPGGWGLRDVSFTIPAGKTVALVGPRCARGQAWSCLGCLLGAAAWRGRCLRGAAAGCYN